VKITRNSLKELIRQSIDELKEGGPGSGRPKGSDSDKAFNKKYKKDPAHDKDYISDPLPDRSKKKKTKDEPFDSGGPSYANVPKGAKTSKQAKEMSKKKKKKKKSTYTHTGDDKVVSMKVRESKGRKTTVKEVKQWMRTLEENRYKKTYNSDCRRVSWMVNHMGEGVENMPESMRKKWTKAEYGRERYLAKEFVKSQKAKINEISFRNKIRNIILKNGRPNGLR